MVNIDALLNNIDMDNLIVPFGRIRKINSTTIVASGLVVAIGDVVKIES
jgi:flagellum-specific ATP synthase